MMLDFQFHVNEPILGEKNVMLGVVKDYTELNQKLNSAWKYFEDKNIWNESKTNLTGQQTPYFSQLYSSDVSEVISSLKPYVENFFVKSKNFKHRLNQFVKCGEAWMSKYQGGQAHEHSHYPFHVTCVYYFDVEDAKPLRVTTIDQRFGQIFKEIIPTNGLLVLFDGDIDHHVLPTEGKRGVLASNWYYDMGEYVRIGIEEQGLSNISLDN